VRKRAFETSGAGRRLRLKGGKWERHTFVEQERGRGEGESGKLIRNKRYYRLENVSSAKRFGLVGPCRLAPSVRRRAGNGRKRINSAAFIRSTVLPAFTLSVFQCQRL